MKLKNYKPEVRSLLNRLRETHLFLHACDNGGGRELFDGDMEKFVEALTATDDAHLYVKDSLNREWELWLVLGNESGVIVADYAVDPDGKLDLVVEAHGDAWEGRPVPSYEPPTCDRCHRDYFKPTPGADGLCPSCAAKEKGVPA